MSVQQERSGSNFFQYEVMNSLIEAIPSEMAVIMKQTSYSPIFNEVLDFSTAILTAEGDLIAQYIGVPVHLAAMEFCLKAIIRKFKDSLQPGDIVIHNDPYDGGSHLPDINIVMPVFYDGELIAFTANRGHHADVGGANPGSFAGDSTSIFQEGVRIPAMKIYKAGQLNGDIMDFLCANVRAPKFTEGDIHAQIASCRLGERRLKGLLDKYGAGLIKQTMVWAMDYSEKRMRAEISSWPDGVYECEDYMDSDGVDIDRPVKVKATVTIRGDELTVDLTGSDPAVKGPINGALASVTAGVYIAILNMSDPTIPSNHGCYRPVTVIAPPGSVVNAQYPSPVVSGNCEMALHVIHTVTAAFAKALPDRVTAADAGTTANLCGGGTDPVTGEPYVFCLSLPSGSGARKTKDGLIVCLSGRLGGLNQYMSLEMFEARFPFLTERYNLVPDSGGPGRFKGGLTAEWVVRPLGHTCELVGCTEKSNIPPYGLFGGMPGLHGDWHVSYADGRPDKDISKSSALVSEKDVIYIRTPAGGGYGDPLEREAEFIQFDLDEGYITAESAQRDYGCVVDRSTGKIDPEATAARRAQLKPIWNRGSLFLDEGTQPYAKKAFRTVTLDGKDHFCS